MDVESPDSYNKHSQNDSDWPSSSRDRNKSDERVAFFNLHEPLSHNNIQSFVTSFERTKSPDTQLDFMNCLMSSSPDIILHFSENKGTIIAARILKQCIVGLENKVELASKIVSFLNRINLTKDDLTKTRVHETVDAIKNHSQCSDELSGKTFKLLTKWKKTIDEWVDDDGEAKARRYEREQEQKKFQKRTHTHHSEGGPRDKYPGGNDRGGYDKYGGSKRHDGGRRSESPPPQRGGQSGGMRDKRRGDDGYLKKRKGRDMFREDDKGLYRRSGVSWVEEKDLTAVKFYCTTDEPSHEALTEDEVKKIQDEITEKMKNEYILHGDQLKHRESLLEANSIKQKKDSERELQHQLDQMKESIEWYEPKAAKVIADQPRDRGRYSIEKDNHEKRIEGKLAALYLKEYQIPEHPSYNSIINKNLPQEKPLSIPLFNSDGAQEDVITDQNGEYIYLSEYLEREKEKERLKQKEAEEAKNDQKKAKPLRGILRKKSRHGEEEEKKDNEKEALKQKNKLDIEPQLVLKIINGDFNEKEKGTFVKALRESGCADDVLQNISTIKNFLDNVQKIRNAEKGSTSTNPMEGRKMIKTNDEPEPNMYNPTNDPKMFFPQQGMPNNNNMVGNNNPQMFGNQAGMMRGNSNMQQPMTQHMQNQQPHDMGGPQHHQGGNPQMHHQGPNQQQRQPHNIPNQFDRQSSQEGGNMMHNENAGGGHNQNQNKLTYKPNNYKTIPCAKFHSSQGCTRGEGCHFIHDLNYPGRETPNMRKYVRNNLIGEDHHHHQEGHKQQHQMGQNKPMQQNQMMHQMSGGGGGGQQGSGNQRMGGGGQQGGSQMQNQQSGNRGMPPNLQRQNTGGSNQGNFNNPNQQPLMRQNTPQNQSFNSNSGQGGQSFNQQYNNTNNQYQQQNQGGNFQGSQNFGNQQQGGNQRFNNQGGNNSSQHQNQYNPQQGGGHQHHHQDRQSMGGGNNNNQGGSFSGSNQYNPMAPNYNKNPSQGGGNFGGNSGGNQGSYNQGRPGGQQQQNQGQQFNQRMGNNQGMQGGGQHQQHPPNNNFNKGGMQPRNFNQGQQQQNYQNPPPQPHMGGGGNQGNNSGGGNMRGGFQNQPGHGPPPGKPSPYQQQGNQQQFGQRSQGGGNNMRQNYHH